MDTLTIILLIINLFYVAEAPLTDGAMHDFELKMEPYYLESSMPTDTSNLMISELPNNYWGATVWKDACTNQVYLSDEFTDPNHAFYNTPMWKYVLAHEWAHVAQGQDCWDGRWKESFTSCFFWPFVTGTILIGLLLRIPWIDWPLRILILCIGMGAMWQVLWGSARPSKKD